MTSTNQAKLNYKIILNTHTGLKFNQANNPANLLTKSWLIFNLPTLDDEGFDAFENEAAIGLVGSVPGILTVLNFFAGSFEILKFGLITCGVPPC